jgi:ACS family hexuronate transporter-like MFS transporter
MKGKEAVMTNWRWVMCSLLFFATTVNYLDRQVLSLTYEEFIKPQFHWTDADYGTVTGFFSLFYAVACLFAGKFIDWIGVKRGYIISICVWSLGAVMHAACGVVTASMTGVGSAAALKGLETGSTVALAVSTTSVYLFMFCRAVLALGEAGNFPSAMKVTAEFFPRKDRGLATTIFNAGSSIGALVAPLCIPPLAKNLGWEMAFIIIGALGFIWVFFWVFLYKPAENNRHVNALELEYIKQDEAEEEALREQARREKAIPMARCLRYRQTWMMVLGKFISDCVWWFFLFWAPSYFDTEFGAKATSPTGKLLLITLYALAAGLSIFGGYLPKFFVEKKGMHPYDARMRSMLVYAIIPLLAILAQPMGAWTGSPWGPAILIGLAAAGHCAWSSNLFNLPGDLFPRSTIGTITGLCSLAGGISTMALQKLAGNLFTFAEKAGGAFRFAGFEGKSAGYLVIFCYCGVAYLLSWVVMKAILPKYKPVEE